MLFLIAYSFTTSGRDVVEARSHKTDVIGVLAA